MTTIKVPEALSDLLSTTPELKRSYLVGGCVRDAVLGFTPKDFDVEVFGVTYDQLAGALAQHGRVDVVGRSFGVLKLTADGQTFDFTLPRLDSRSGDGHRGFDVSVNPLLTLAEAASRRDFTINALAYDPRTGEVIDSFNGLRDLDKGILRHIGPSFSDDPLRVLRGMQFVSRYNLLPAVETVVLCRKMRHRFKELSVERVWNEWFKWAAMSKTPSYGLWFLHDTGWIDHFPEIERLVKHKQDRVWHPEGDVFVHTMHACNALAHSARWARKTAKERATLLLGVLCHDMGKPDTTEVVLRDGVERIISPAHDSVGGPIARRFLQRIGAPDLVKQKVQNLVENHMAHLPEPSSKSVRRLSVRIQPATIDDLLIVIEADHSGRPPLPGGLPLHAVQIGQLAAELAVKDSAPVPILMGRHLIAAGYEPSPWFKNVLSAAFEAQLNGAFNDEVGALSWFNLQTLIRREFQ